MITDEMILKIHQDTAKHGGIVEFARDLIAMAQEVRPLEWARLDHFDTWIAPGIDYDYIIPITEGCYHLHYGDDVLCSSNLIYPLKDAAQADFNRRVLSNLVHGDTK